MKRLTALLAIICLAMVSMAAKADTLQFDNNPSGTVTGPYNLTYANAPVPEPSSLLLFGSGLLGLAFVVRRKMSRA